MDIRLAWQKPLKKLYHIRLDLHFAKIYGTDKIDDTTWLQVMGMRVTGIVVLQGRSMVPIRLSVARYIALHAQAHKPTQVPPTSQKMDL